MDKKCKLTQFVKKHRHSCFCRRMTQRQGTRTGYMKRFDQFDPVAFLQRDLRSRGCKQVDGRQLDGRGLDLPPGSLSIIIGRSDASWNSSTSIDVIDVMDDESRSIFSHCAMVQSMVCSALFRMCLISNIRSCFSLSFLDMTISLSLISLVRISNF